MSNALSIDGLSVSYGPIPALKNVSIEVPNGGFVTVLGNALQGRSNSAARRYRSQRVGASFAVASPTYPKEGCYFHN
jgi:hypothetical protein